MDKLLSNRSEVPQGDSDFLRAEARERSYALKDSDPLWAEAHAESYAPQGDSDFLWAEAHERSYVASAGWEHPEWNGCFYPDDLPPEWRLAYYAHIFSCVYLPYAAWSGCDLQTLSGWVGDTPERFRFVLEANPRGNTDPDQARLQVLAPRIGLVLDNPGGRVLWLEGSPDLKKLAKSLRESAASHCPDYLISLDHNLEAMNRVVTLLEIMGLMTCARDCCPRCPGLEYALSLKEQIKCLPKIWLKSAT